MCNQELIQLWGLFQTSLYTGRPVRALLLELYHPEQFTSSPV